MKITQFTFALGVGGAESVIKEYALSLALRGHDVTVVVLLPFHHNENEKKLINAGVKLISIFEEIFLIKKNNIVLKILRLPFRTFLVRRWIKKYLNTAQQNVFHAHLNVLPYIPIGVCKKNNISLFFTCHSEASYYFGEKNSREVKILQSLSKTDNIMVFALHERMKQELYELCKITNIQVLNNPVDLRRFQISLPPIEIRKKLGFSDKDFIIGHVGRFIYPKNHQFIIDIFNEVLKIKPVSKLVLVGDGELRESIEKKCKKLGIAQKVYFLGNRTDIPEILSIFDVFLFPSHFEGLSIALIEAQVKVPYLITSTNVSKDSSVSNKVVYYSLENDAKAWASEIITHKTTPFIANNHIEDFDIQNVVLRLESFYSSNK